ncbi:MAG TPA: DUF3052 domain-containing protein [Chthoniobacterales bacterium]|jgi:hypothetical protein
MAGYSRTPLAKKLGLKPNAVVAPIDAPANYRRLLAPLPPGVRFAQPNREADVIHYFVREREDFRRELPRLRRLLRDDAALWVSWPKKSSPLAASMTEDVVREFALPLGLVDNKVCAVDETWSGLRLVVRLINRATR